MLTVILLAVALKTLTFPVRFFSCSNTIILLSLFTSRTRRLFVIFFSLEDNSPYLLPTMQFSLALAALLPALAVYAVDIPVQVGLNGSLTFTPSSVTANVQDNIIFTFLAKNHSVTQSTFASPCVAMPGGIDSGFQLVPPNATQFPQWNITITNTSVPQWMFCAQTVPIVHCSQGMVFAINPTASKTFDAFQAAAQGNSTASSTAGAAGSSGSPATAGSGGSSSGSPAGSSAGSSAGGSAGGSSSSPASPAATTPAANSGVHSVTGGAAAVVLAALGVVVGLVL